jgi:radical SAM protein with 4Fe4S-binding SPASM domain
MLYRQKFDTFIRNYGDIGYICSKKDYGDRVVDMVGGVFLTALSRNAQTLEDLGRKFLSQFIDADYETLKNDIMEFYAMLEEDGFIVSGETEDELNAKDRRFSYSDIEPKTIKKDFTPIIKRSDVSTQLFLDEHFKGKPHLNSLQIELTSRCNERCVHCYIPHENKLANIEDSMFYGVLEQCTKMGLLNLTLSGGEPMLHPHFIDYLRKAQQYDFSVNILSNLTLLNDDIVKEMKANRLSSVQVSLYSMKPEVHDAITKVKGSFYKTRDAILKLIDSDIPLQISCPTMKQNKDDFADVLNWANKYKVRAMTDYIMMARYDHSTGNLDNRLSLYEVEDVINAIRENDTDYEFDILDADFSIPNQQDDSEDIICGICQSSICMVANGKVYPCPGWQDYTLGNLKEETLLQIWENSPRIKFLRNIRKKDFPQCLKCEDKLFCAMCMVRNANENKDGDPFKINRHFCKVAALNKRIVLERKNKIISKK